jgi:hypothetical protein
MHDPRCTAGDSAFRFLSEGVPKTVMKIVLMVS